MHFYLCLEIWHLVATILTILLRMNYRPNFAFFNRKRRKIRVTPKGASPSTPPFFSDFRQIRLCPTHNTVSRSTGIFLCLQPPRGGGNTPNDSGTPTKFGVLGVQRWLASFGDLTPWSKDRDFRKGSSSSTSSSSSSSSSTVHVWCAISKICKERANKDVNFPCFRSR